MVNSLLAHHASAVSVFAVTRKPDPKKSVDLVKKGAKVLPGDFAEPEKLGKALAAAKIDVVYIPPPNLENRAELVNKFVDVCKASGVKRIVLISVPAADGEAILFAKQFNQMEKHLKASGLEYTILRAIAFMENIAGMDQAFREHGVFPTPLRTGKYPPIAIKDIGDSAAAVIANPAKHANKTYTLTGPQALTGDEQAAIVGKVLGLNLKYVDAPIEDFKKALTGFGMAQWQVNGMVELMNVFANNWAAVPSPDVEAILGRKATTLEEWTKAWAATRK